jgi:hypothetical protein
MTRSRAGGDRKGFVKVTSEQNATQSAAGANRPGATFSQNYIAKSEFPPSPLHWRQAASKSRAKVTRTSPGPPE